MTDAKTGKVHLLRLAGRSAVEAVSEADALIDNRAAADIGRLLVTDRAADLADHTEAFAHLLASPRVRYITCLAVGEPVLRGRIVLPACLASDRDSVVLWVADPLGVDWPLSTAVAPRLRPEGGQDGTDLLIALAAVGGAIRPRPRHRRHDAQRHRDPGVRLVEQSDVGAHDFPFALGEAIRRLVAPPVGGNHGRGDPYTEIAPERIAVKTLRDEGTVPTQRRRCADAIALSNRSMTALEGFSNLTGPRRAIGGARTKVAEVGQEPGGASRPGHQSA